MTFKIASTRDLRRADGTAAFSEQAFEELARNQDISWEWLPDDLDELTPDILAQYDGLHVNTPKVSAWSVGRSDCRCKIIARNGVGFDTVDVKACEQRNILVTNTPLAIQRPVAVAALTFIFALAGKMMKKDQLVRTGRWHDRTSFMGVGLTSRRLGLIGAGGIGQELIPLAKPFFQEILVADPFVSPETLANLGASKTSFDDVMTQSDFVVVLCPLTEQTFHMIDERAFSLMKKTAYFINVARGPIHDEEALIRALETGQIAGAGLDVTEQEPLDHRSPLTAMEQVILTPHSLCWTDECFEDIARSALRAIVDVSLGLSPAHPVKAS